MFFRKEIRRIGLVDELEHEFEEKSVKREGKLSRRRQLRAGFDGGGSAALITYVELERQVG